jgi:hypothetical protein
LISAEDEDTCDDDASVVRKKRDDASVVRKKRTGNQSLGVAVFFREAYS